MGIWRRLRCEAQCDGSRTCSGRWWTCTTGTKTACPPAPSVVRADFPCRSFGVCDDQASAQVSTSARDERAPSASSTGSVGAPSPRAIHPMKSSRLTCKSPCTKEACYTLACARPGREKNESERCFKSGGDLEMANGKGKTYALLDRGADLHTVEYRRMPTDVICNGESRCILRCFCESGDANPRNKQICFIAPVAGTGYGSLRE